MSEQIKMNVAVHVLQFNIWNEILKSKFVDLDIKTQLVNLVSETNPAVKKYTARVFSEISKPDVQKGILYTNYDIMPYL